MSGNTLRIFIDPGSPMFCLTKQSNLFICMISGKLEFQCARNASQNPPYCPWSIQDTFIIYSSISHQHTFQNYFAENNNLENQKYGSLKIPKRRFTNKCPDSMSCLGANGCVSSVWQMAETNKVNVATWCTSALCLFQRIPGDYIRF
jgi:hypothetical protein